MPTDTLDYLSKRLIDIELQLRVAHEQINLFKRLGVEEAMKLGQANLTLYLERVEREISAMSGTL